MGRKFSDWNKRTDPLRFAASCFCWFAIMVYALSAAALPDVQTAEDTDEDAAVHLSLLESGIEGDDKHWCEVAVQVTSDDYELQDGDTITVTVYEDDAVGDETLWSEQIDIKSGDLVNGRYENTFACHSKYGTDEGETVQTDWEIYAVATVAKESYPSWELADSPTTAALRVAMEKDDGNEPNDDSGSAVPVGIGTPAASGIAADPDWFKLEVPAAAKISATAHHRPEVGRLRVDLLDSSEQKLSVNLENKDELTKFEEHQVDEGTHYVRVNGVGGAKNFYELDLQMELGGGNSCAANTFQEKSCGKCGVKRRECTDGTWAEWGECKNQGACKKGETRTVSCQNCGRRTDECNSECEWEQGDCEGAGPCAPGDEQQESCQSGGTKTRTCTEECTWGAFSNCSRSGRDIGARCSSSQDCKIGSCASPPEEQRFADGYCTLRGCTKAQGCPQGAVCVSLGSDNFCLATCQSDRDCRPVDYACLPKGEKTVCLPTCESDSECAEGRCDTSRGRCIVESPDAGGDAGRTADAGAASDASSRDGAGDAGTSTVAPGGCGCTSGNGSRRSPWGFGAIALLVFLLSRWVAIRRRGRRHN